MEILTIEPCGAIRHIAQPALNFRQAGPVFGLVGPIILVNVDVTRRVRHAQANVVVEPDRVGVAGRFLHDPVLQMDVSPAVITVGRRQPARKLVERVEGLLVADAMHHQNRRVAGNPLAAQAFRRGLRAQLRPRVGQEGKLELRTGSILRRVHGGGAVDPSPKLPETGALIAHRRRFDKQEVMHSSTLALIGPTPLVVSTRASKNNRI
jgi:hypothetical protein